MPFAKGNKQAKGGARSGSGRKPSAYLEQQKQLADAALPPDVQTAILGSIVEKAKNGDMEAAKFLLHWRLRLETLAQDSEMNRARIMQIQAQTALSREQLKLLRMAQIPEAVVMELMTEMAHACLGFDQRLHWHELRQKTETEEGWDKLRQRKGELLGKAVQALLLDSQQEAKGGIKEVPSLDEDQEEEADDGL